MMIAVSRLKNSLYETDYQLWLDRTLEQLRSQDFSNIDLDNLIEEIEDLGKSGKRAIVSYVVRLCEHLLKIAYWDCERERCFRGWDVEITHFRWQIQASLKDSPSLKSHLNENFEVAYRNGRKLFLKASGLEPTCIPEQPCFALEEALDEDWLPEQLSRPH